MGYVEDTRGSGETIEYDVSFHWLWTFSAYTIFVILVAAALGLFLLFSPMTSVEAIEPMIRLLPSLVLAVIGLVIFLYMMIKKWTTERVLTDLRFVQKTGWIIRHTEEIRIDRMEEVNLDQSLLGRILDYGDIQIAGVGTGEIKLKMIDSPIEFQKKLNDLKVKFAPSPP